MTRAQAEDLDRASKTPGARPGSGTRRRNDMGKIIEAALGVAFAGWELVQAVIEAIDRRVGRGFH